MHRLLAGTLALAGAAALPLAACDSKDTGPLRVPCVAPARTPSRVATLAPAAPFGDRTFDHPIEIVSGPAGRFYVLEQAGVVRTVPPDGGATATAIDLTAKVKSGGEAGLLGIAFDPGFAQNGFVYLHYDQELEKKPDVVFQSIIARYTSSDGGLTFDPATEKRILVVDQPFANHNGGKIAFGPDRFLYIAFGDGGSGGDPRGNGQNRDVLLGKILRLDPNGGDPYAIPKDNPFAGGGGRPEIYAYGLRNPWKFSFDRATGDLWAADVGQSRYEEIDRIVLGGNYGWNVREGAHCFQAETCATDGLIDPVAEYGRSQGVSVTGGYVYRGAKLPGLVGKLIYGDYGTGTIWALDRDAAGAYVPAPIVSQTGFRISSFAQGDDGEVWVADHSTGRVHAIVPESAELPADGGGAKLSETGCVDTSAPTKAPEGLIAYDVRSPLWSDGAKKDRWLYVPEGRTIGIAPDGDFDVPPGSVAVKTFGIEGKLVETRLFVRYEDGTYAGYSYEWNDEQTDATLLASGKTKTLPSGATWTFPSREECFACHTSVAGFTLGLEARQVDVDRFAAYLARPMKNDEVPKLAAADTPGASDEQRARGYLHANCSICHREGGGAGAATIDLRVDRTLAEMRACNVAPSGGDLGIAGAKLVTPGDPSRSTIPLRMRALDRNRMPPLASRVVDESGANAVEAWIRGLAACP